MLFVSLSLATPLVGPLLLIWLGRHPKAHAAVDGFLVVAVLGLVVLHIVPASMAQLGWPAIVAMAVGLSVPRLLHDVHPKPPPSSAPALTVLAASAVLAHAFFDGIALATIVGTGAVVSARALALSVVLHRFLEGAGIVWLVDVAFERRTAPRVVALLAHALATLLGMGLALRAQAAGFEAWVGLVQALVAGSLVHVVAGHPEKRDTSKFANRLLSSMGGVFAAFLLWALALAEGERLFFPWPHCAQRFAPAALVGLVMTAFAHALPVFEAPRGRPHAPSHNLAPKLFRRLKDAAWGAMHGLSIPACACGMLPLYARLLAQRAAPGHALAFAVAAPALGVVPLCVSMAVLGLQLTLVRVVVVFVLASVAGFVAVDTNEAAYTKRQKVDAATPNRHGHLDLWARLVDGGKFAVGEGLGFFAPWFVVGLAAAHAFETHPFSLLRGAWPMSAALWASLAMAVIAAPLHVCGAATTLVAAALLENGLAAGPTLALLVAAPAVSSASMAAIARRQGFVAAVVTGIVVVTGAAASGACVSLLKSPSPNVPAAVLWGPINAWAQLILVALIVGRLLVLGVRGALWQLLVPNSHAGHSYHHNAHHQVHRC